jgi:hypothetical protein
MKWMTVTAGTALFALVAGASPATAFAQTAQYASYKVAAADTTYSQQHTIDVGDVPGHQLRIYEIQRQFPKNGPVIGGLRLVKQVDRAFSDYTDFKGPAVVYGVWEFENGDKFYARGDQVTESKRNPDGSLFATSHRISKITGGTGKFQAMKGTLDALTTLDNKTGKNETQVDLEYSMGK